MAKVELAVDPPLDEEGDRIHPRIWNHEFIKLPLVIKEKQNRPTITEAEISAMLTTLKGRDAVLVALVAGTGLRIGEALAIRTDDFDPLCRLLQVRRSVWRRRGVDSQAQGSRLGFRFLIFPGVAAFWTLFLRRWLKANGEQPLEGNPH
jgi:integrase